MLHALQTNTHSELPANQLQTTLCHTPSKTAEAASLGALAAPNLAVLQQKEASFRSKKQGSAIKLDALGASTAGNVKINATGNGRLQ
jgi:hypothetical protein